MIKKIRKICFVFILIPLSLYGEIICNTSFEMPEYHVGSIDGQQHWCVNSGIGRILVSKDSSFAGEQCLNVSTTEKTLNILNTPFTSQEAGLSGILYLNMYVRIDRLENKYFAISGYDLFGSSEKRTFVFEFNTPSGSSGIFNIYDGSSKKQTGIWSKNIWNRLSARIDFNQETYQVIFNGGESISAAFRESYTPPINSVRPNSEKQFHQLRFNLGYDTAIGSVNAFLDNLYIGRNPIPDVHFEETVNFWTINVENPEVGSITLVPELDSYPDSMWITAILKLPKGYMNMGWTGDLSGTDTSVTFQITRHITLGANVEIDPQNPPEIFTITCVQPDTGWIYLDPPGGEYYAYSRVTAWVDIPPGYLFAGWTGDVTGIEQEYSWVVLQDMTLGANIVKDTIPSKVYIVSTASEFKNLCLSPHRRPGDVIELTDGNYNIGGMTMTIRGTANKPIVFRAQNRGGVVLSGGSNFTLKESEYVIIEGFEFVSEVYTVIKLEACHHVQITRNVFHLTESDNSGGKWVLIGGIWNDATKKSHHNRVDYNLFENKHQPGNFITIDGGDTVSQYDVIAFNYFRNIGPRRENEMEAIRVGVSGMSLTDGFTLIEHNLFESCDGDPEIISIKSCKDTVRYNTFMESQGTVCLRQGHGSVVEGNFFFGNGKAGTGGVRVYGYNHTLVNNYFENLTGHTWDAPLTLTNGDVSSGAENAHWQIQNVKILMNTFINNKATIEIGYSGTNNTWKKVPQNLFFYGNLIYNGDDPAIVYFSSPQNAVWQKNIAYDSDGTDLGISAETDEILQIDPLLETRHDLYNLQQPSEKSIGATYLDSLPWITDLFGRKRSLPGTVGALELDGIGDMVNLPLLPQNVGPNAEQMPASIQRDREKKWVGDIPDSFLLNAYPNPFNGEISLQIQLPIKTKVKIDVFSLDGRHIEKLTNSVYPRGISCILWKPQNVATGIYLIQIQIMGKQQSKKVLYVK
ncbi:MAG: chondroitinase-B domain-containing protein [Candidatus Marinimicrobia bacterium]|nr:chondroitinase-B domain-containing protein [Candidatus Neomarinimicrobiota bacterium]